MTAAVKANIFACVLRQSGCHFSIVQVTDQIQVGQRMCTICLNETERVIIVTLIWIPWN